MSNTNDESLHAWESNAKYWDNYMGDESNFFSVRNKLTIKNIKKQRV